MQETAAEADGGSQEVRAAGQNTVAGDGRRPQPSGIPSQAQQQGVKRVITSQAWTPPALSHASRPTAMNCSTAKTASWIRNLASSSRDSDTSRDIQPRAGQAGCCRPPRSVQRRWAAAQASIRFSSINFWRAGMRECWVEGGRLCLRCLCGGDDEDAAGGMCAHARCPAARAHSAAGDPRFSAARGLSGTMAGLCALLLCWAQAVGGQRELRGWSLQTRISNGTSGSVDPNLEPLPGSCLNGTIIRYLEARSVAECELACGYTPGCRWFSYCASHLDVALPVAHAYDMHYCRFESLLDGTVEPMSAFGYKKDKCVLFSQCRRTGTNMNGSLPYVGFYIYEFGARSVMTGRNTAFFPDELPEKLKSKFHVPDSLHPNLRFWFTPEQLDSEGHVDGDRVSVWKNVANICYRDTGKGSHPEWLMTNGSLSSIQGHCRNAYSPVMRGTWAQEYGEVTNFVQTIGNSQKEILYQHAPAHMPQYRKNMAPNGHSALRFKRKDQDGTRGKFMYMYTMVGDKQGFEVC